MAPFSIIASQPRGKGRGGGWWQSLEDGRQAKQIVQGQCDFRGHFSSRVGWKMKVGLILVSDGHWAT